MTNKNNRILGIEENLLVSTFWFVLAAIDTVLVIYHFRNGNNADCIISSLFAFVSYVCGYVKVCDHKDDVTKEGK